MSYETYRYIFIIAAILCGIMFVVSILVFFLLKIPKVIGDLTGATAKKAIKNIREQNERSGDKMYKASAVNRDRGKLTDKISPSGRVVPQSSGHTGWGVDTTKIATQHLAGGEQGTTVLSDTPETTVLTPAAETSVLDNSGMGYAETSVLHQAAETSVLTPMAETSVLNATMNPAPVMEMDHTVDLNAVGFGSSEPEIAQTGRLQAEKPADASFAIEYDITYIHTNEVI